MLHFALPVANHVHNASAFQPHETLRQAGALSPTRLLPCAVATPFHGPRPPAPRVLQVPAIPCFPDTLHGLISIARTLAPQLPGGVGVGSVADSDSSSDSSIDEAETAAVEMLLEAYFMQVDNTYNRLQVRARGRV